MLSSVAQAISLGMTEALKWFVQWGGADPAGVKLELNRDFYPQPMTSQMLTALLAGWQAGAFSFETLFNNLQAGEIIAIDADAESEQVKIDDEMKLAAKLQAKLVPEQTIPVPADPNNPNPPPGDKGTQIGG